MKKIDVKSGEVTFEGFRFRWIVTVLHSSVEFSEEMPENHERGIINRAVRSVASTGTITSGRLLHAIGEGEEAFKQQPSEAFVLVTSLSARHFEGLANRKMGDISLSFNRYLPAPFHAEHEKARAIARDQVIGRLPKMGAGVMWAYMLTRVSVQARSHQEALEMSLDALDLLRGVWNLALNREVGMRSSGGIRKPVNRLVLGPIHSLHAPNGNLIDESPWIDDDYVGPLVTYKMMPDWDYIQEFEDFVWQELSRIPYRRDLETSIRMYTRALDARDWNTSFVRLWALLETLTATYRHQEVVRRVLPMVKDEHKDFHRQILRHLYGYRNKTVHTGHETVALEVLLYQLKFHAENLLEFHLSALPAFESVEDAALFLDTATEEQVSRRLSGK